jgi:hypothetical protein
MGENIVSPLIIRPLTICQDEFSEILTPGPIFNNQVTIAVNQYLLSKEDGF